VETARRGAEPLGGAPCIGHVRSARVIRRNHRLIAFLRGVAEGEDAVFFRDDHRGRLTALEQRIEGIAAPVGQLEAGIT